MLGGTVGEWSTLLVGAPELVPGSEYVLFLSEGSLPGAERILTAPGHVQAVFDVITDPVSGERRAVSQAANEPLVPDDAGRTGGAAAAPVFSEVMAETLRLLRVPAAGSDVVGSGAELRVAVRQ